MTVLLDAFLSSLSEPKTQEAIKQVIPYFLSAVTLYMTFLQGKKNKAGWALGICSQFVWLGYMLWTKQYGFLPLNLGLTALYLKNYLEWAAAERMPDSVSFSSQSKGRIENTNPPPAYARPSMPPRGVVVSSPSSMFFNDMYAEIPEHVTKELLKVLRGNQHGRILISMADWGFRFPVVSPGNISKEELTISYLQRHPSGLVDIPLGVFEFEGYDPQSTTPNTKAYFVPLVNNPAHIEKLPLRLYVKKVELVYSPFYQIGEIQVRRRT